MPLVFVYGTLMRAGANHPVLTRLSGRFVAAATTKAPRTLVDLGPYPALLPPDAAPAPTTLVAGELWEIDDSALRELDAFEGCPELYTRERVALVSGAGAEAAEVEAFVYVLAGRAPRSARVIADGRYVAEGVGVPEGAQRRTGRRRRGGG